MFQQTATFFNFVGEEMFDENGTKEDSYDGITEKISDFASSKQLSEANFNINNFQGMNVYFVLNDTFCS